MIRVAHVISATGTYGGERFVPALAHAQRAAGIDALVVTGCSRHDVVSLARRLRALRPEIVHTHLAHAKHWGRLAALLTGVPHIVHTEHANDFRSPLPLRLLSRFLHARTDRVVAFTQAQAQRIAKYERVPLDRIVIIPNGIDTDELESCRRDSARAALGIEPEICMILCVGRLDAVKRYDRALEALALLPQSANVHLFIAGDGRLREQIRRYASERGVADRLHLLGYRNDVPRLLSAADVVLNTSESEGMPLSLIEALCSGIPVVSTPWPGAGQFLAGSARVTADSRPESIAATLQAALSDARQSTPLDDLRERFSIGRVAAKHASLYAEVLGREQAQHASPTPSSVAPDGLPPLEPRY